MDITTPFLTVAQLGAAPLVIGIVSLLKSSSLTGSDHRWAPIASLVSGSGLVWLIPSGTWQMTVLAGITVGLIAAGVYSGIKTTVAPEK